MFEKVFGKDKSHGEEKKRFSISMSSKKPITLMYIAAPDEQILLGKETTSFKGEISVPGNIDGIQFGFEGENLRSKRNTIRLEIEY